MARLRYLDNTYLFKLTATIVEVREDEKGKAVILDETIFYPQGGGQPADRGIISSEGNTFVVGDVKFDEDGEVLHIGEFKEGEFSVGDEVTLEIDEGRRILNARLHSAGHLLNYTVSRTPGMEGWHSTKGFHFPEGTYVEYEGASEDISALIPSLQGVLDELLAKNMKISKREIPSGEATAQGIRVPAGKLARIVGFDGFPACGCGGTHVNDTSEIGRVVVRKIKNIQGKMRISYTIE